jgi:Transposase DDE domain
MKKTLREKRNWSQYNQKLKKIARIDFFISEEAIEEWEYVGARKPDGKKIYNDHVIEMCLLMREFYKLAYRQTEGFISSVLQLMRIDLAVPDYTTMSRRAANLKLNIRNKELVDKNRESIVI